LLHADPGYKGRIKAAARNASELAAWMDGSWDIVAGGMFDDIWYEYRDTIVMEPFDIPPGWKIYRAYDHGSSKPFSVGWYAVSDGTDFMLKDGRMRSTVRGDYFRFKEWYGWRGQPNEGSRMLVADIKGIIEREIKWGLRDPNAQWTRVSRGPADSSIFDDNTNGSEVTIAATSRSRDDQWRQAPRHLLGASRQGTALARAGMGARSKAAQGDQASAGRLPGNPRTVHHDRVPQWLRCVPVLPRDELKIDDVDDESEDHNGDETRYMLRFEIRTMKSGRVA
jgi:hypothetical protein